MRRAKTVAVVVLCVTVFALGLLLLGNAERSSMDAGTSVDSITKESFPADKKAFLRDSRMRGSMESSESQKQREQTESGHVTEEGADSPEALDCWNRCGAPCVNGDAECPKVCESDAECGSEELCSMTATTGEGNRVQRCLASQCNSDIDCGEGKSCRYIGRMEGGIYVCGKSGVRKAGELCAHDEYDPIGLCDKGLHCGNGVCAKNDCEIDEDCGDGAKCYTSAGGDGVRSCTASCDRDSDCPEGKLCNDYSESGLPIFGRCTSTKAMGCLASGCGDNEECIVNQEFGSYVITSCMSLCSKKSECADEGICSTDGYCYQRCTADGDDCPSEWQCYTDPEDNVSGCVRDVEEAERQLFLGLEREG